MRNKILGVIGILWGGFILANHFLRATPPPSGNAARDAGSSAGLILGGLMLAAGIYALVKPKSPDEEKK